MQLDRLSVVDSVLAGDDSGAVTLGYPAFLGVGLSTTGGAALVAVRWTDAGGTAQSATLTLERGPVA